MRFDLLPLEGAMRPLLREFGLELSQADLLENGWTCLRLINHEYRAHHVCLSRVQRDGDGRQFVHLPCNAREVHAVLPADERYVADPLHCPPRHLVAGPELVHDQIQQTDCWHTLDYQPWQTLPGSYYPFSLTDRGLLVHPRAGVACEAFVFVCYSGYLCNCDGQPLITEADALAVAAYCNFVNQQIRFFQQLSNASLLEAAVEIKDRRINQARSRPISPDEMSAVLRVKTSFNRGSHAEPTLGLGLPAQNRFRTLPNPRGSRWQ